MKPLCKGNCGKFKAYAMQPWSGEGMSAQCLRDSRVSHNHPYDPDDWCRCIQVLRLMFGDREEAKRLHILAVAEACNSKVWKNIGENYYELMRTFESEWEGCHAPKTYDLMQKLREAAE